MCVCVRGCCVHVWFVCKLNTASDWLTNSHSTLESQSPSLMWLSCPSLLPLQLRWLRAESDDNSFNWAASVCNLQLLIVSNGNSVVMMGTVISYITHYWQKVTPLLTLFTVTHCWQTSGGLCSEVWGRYHRHDGGGAEVEQVNNVWFLRINIIVHLGQHTSPPCLTRLDFLLKIRLTKFNFTVVQQKSFWLETSQIVYLFHPTTEVFAVRWQEI